MFEQPLISPRIARVSRRYAWETRSAGSQGRREGAPHLLVPALARLVLTLPHCTSPRPPRLVSSRLVVARRRRTRARGCIRLQLSECRLSPLRPLLHRDATEK